MLCCWLPEKELEASVFALSKTCLSKKKEKRIEAVLVTLSETIVDGACGQQLLSKRKCPH